jgi:hypothetical protein
MIFALKMSAQTCSSRAIDWRDGWFICSAFFFALFAAISFSGPAVARETSSSTTTVIEVQDHICVNQRSSAVVHSLSLFRVHSCPLFRVHSWSSLRSFAAILVELR